jgi:hypothetical protein
MSMQDALDANARALQAGRCTAANDYDLKCSAPAVYLLDAWMFGQSVTEGVCVEHLAEEVDNALGGGCPSVTVSLVSQGKP